MIQRKRPELPTGVEDEVPYDQTGMMGSETPDPAMGLGAIGQPAAPQMDLSSLGQPAPSSMAPVDPSVVDGDLSMLDQPEEIPSEEDMAVEQMTSALEDPNTPPEMKAQIEQELALAARRQLAGLGGQ